MIVEEDEIRDGVSDDGDAMSPCCVYAGGESFGIETRQIREVLGERKLHRVPLAPAFVRGVVPYRGEVLTTVNLRTLLGLDGCFEKSCVMVLEDEVGAESLHIGGKGQVAVRRIVQDGNRFDGAARSAEVVSIAHGDGGVVSIQNEWGVGCER